LDCAFMAAIGLFLTLTVLSSWLFVTTDAKYGWLDEAVFAPVLDDRRLSNIRDPALATGFADMALDRIGRSLFVVRTDGTLHRWDLDTELWTESDPGGLDTITSRIRAISADCGVERPSPTCVPGLVWAISEEGGLAAWNPGGGWRTVIGETRWTSATGEPIDHADLSALAVSDDGRWLLLATGGGDMAVFDTQTSSWVGAPGLGATAAIATPAATADNPDATGAGSAPDLTAGGVVHLAWTLERFWIAREEGLFTFDPTAAPDARPVTTGIDGRILDLEREESGAILVLSEGRCGSPRQNEAANGETVDGALQSGQAPLPSAASCLALDRFTARDRVVSVMRETDRDEALSQSGIRHVAIQNGRFVTAGAAGLHAYDPDRRAWKTLVAGAVTAVTESFDGRSVYAAVPGRVVAVRDARLATDWALTSSPIERILPTVSNGILALAQDRKSYRLPEGRAAQTIWAPSRSSADLRTVSSAVMLGSEALLRHRDGVVLHDVIRREYEDIPNTEVPVQLTAPGTRLFSAGTASLWALDPVGRLSVAERAPPDAAGPSLRTIGQDVGPPILRFAPYGPNTTAGSSFAEGGAFAIRDGIGPVRFSAQASGIAVDTLLGRPKPAALGPPVAVDVMPNGSVLVADDQQLWGYDFVDRAWKGPYVIGWEAQSFVDAFVNERGDITASGTRGQLVVVKEDFQAPEWLLGHGPLLPFPTSEMDDVLRDDRGRLVLAGAGEIVAYDPAKREIDGHWLLAEKQNAPIRLVGSHRGTPIAVQAGLGFFGTLKLNQPGASVLQASVDERSIVTVQERDGIRFLVVFDLSDDGISGDARCYFGDPDPAEPALRDVAQVSAGYAAALTGSRVTLYDVGSRRWKETGWTGLGPARRLAILGEHAVAFGPKDFSAVPLADLSRPLGCDPSGPLPVNALSRTAESVAVDPEGGVGAFLDADGAISIWEGGAVRDILRSPSKGPNPKTLRRVYEDGADIIFLDPSAAWLYRTSTRTWQRIAFQGVPETPVETLDARRIGPGSFALTLWLEDGRSYGGILRTAQGRAVLAPMAGLSLPPAEGDFSKLLDARESAGRWYFLFHDRLSVLPEDGGSWIAHLSFEEPLSERRFALFGADPVILEGPGDAPTRLYYLTPNALSESDAGPLRTSMRDAAAVLDLTGIFDFGAVDLGIPGIPARAIAVIGGEGIARFCPIIPGAVDLAGCHALNKPPVRLAATVVTEAYAVSDNMIVWHDGTASLLDRSARLLSALPSIARTVDPADADVYAVDEAVFMRTGDGRVLRFDDTGAVDEIDRDIVRLFSVDLAGDPLLAAGLDGRSHLFTESGAPITFSALAGAEGAGAFRALTRTPVGLTALRDDRVVINVSGGGVARNAALRGVDAPVLRQPLSVIIGRLQIGGVARSGIWLQDGTRLSFIYTQVCPAPDVWDGAGDVWRVCAVTPVQIDLSDDFLSAPVQAVYPRQGSEHLELRTAVETFIWDGTVLQAQSKTPTNELKTATRLRDSVVADIVQLADGSSALDVPTFVQLNDWRLQQTPTTFKTLRAFQHRPKSADPLSGDWLRWRPDDAVFEVGSEDGFERLAPEAIVSDGQFLPTVPGRFYKMSETLEIGLTRHGLWRYRQGRAAPEFEALDLSALSGVAHGRALLGQPSLLLDGGSIGPDGDRSRILREDLVITEDWRGQSVRAQLRDSNGARDAFATLGFLFDQREAVGWIGRDAAVLTPMGSIAIDRFSILAPRPPLDGAGNAGAVRFHKQGATTYAELGDKDWYRLGADRLWVSVSDPFNGQMRWRSPGRNWVAVGDRIDVRRATFDGAVDLTSRRSSGGFAADVLMGGVVDSNGLVLTTEAGTLTAQSAAARRLETGAFAGAPLPAQPSPLRLYRDGGATVILAGEGDEARLWDAAAGAWTLIGASDPRRERLAAEVGRIRIAWRQGWDARVCMDFPGVGRCGAGSENPSLYRPFSWGRDAYFPFNIAGDIHDLGGETVAVATDLGLRILSSTGDRLIAMTSSGPLEAAERIETPYDRRDSVVALSASGCLMLRPSGDWKMCSERISLDHVFRGESPYWRWGWRDGRPEMRYRHADGSEFAERFPGLPSEWFPHDDLSDLVACQGEALSLRADGYVERYSDVRAHPLHRVAAIAAPGETGRLFCLGQAQSLGFGMAMQGLYFVADTDVYRLNEGRWEHQEDPVARYIGKALRGEVQPQFGRLRLAQKADAGYGFELLRRGGQWSPLAWAEDGRLSIDVHLGPIADAHGSLWYLTAGGWMRYSGAGAITVDPVNVVLVDAGALHDCEIDRIETLNGATRGAAATADEDTRLRCGDGRVFQGRLDGLTEKGVFQPLEEDPFVTLAVSMPVSNAVSLNWTLTHPAGADVEADITFNGETVALNTGRFAFDDLRVIHVFEPGSLEVVSRDGWHRTDEALSLGATVRAPMIGVDGARVVALTTDRSRGGSDKTLCASFNSGGDVAFDLEGGRRQDASCRHYLGEDPLWVYRSDRDGLRITAQAENGPLVERRLEAGRFSDLFATGLPKPGSSPNSALVPAKDGVNVFSSTSWEQLGLFSFQAADGTVVAALDGSNAYLSRTGLSPLAFGSRSFEAERLQQVAVCPAVREVFAKLPPGITVLEGHQSHPDKWGFRGVMDDTLFQAQAYCDIDPPELFGWVVSQNVASRPRFVQNVSEWGDGGSGLTYSWKDGDLYARVGAGKEVLLGTGLGVENTDGPVRLLLEGGRVFLLTAEEVYTGDVDALLTALNRPPTDGPVASGSRIDIDLAGARPVGRSDEDRESTDDDATRVSAKPKELRAIQAYLAAKGLYFGEIDGLIGPQTRAAIATYETRHGVALTGEVTRWLLRRVNASRSESG
jgi:hypothetical protein